MNHPVYQVLSFEIVEKYILKVFFDDYSSKVIDFEPILAGDIYGPLKNIGLFNQVSIDSEINTLVWPNGADFDPETLYNWDEYLSFFEARIAEWKKVA